MSQSQSYDSLQEFAKHHTKLTQMLHEASKEIVYTCTHKPHGLKKAREAQEIQNSLRRAIAILQRKYSTSEEFRAAITRGDFTEATHISEQVLLHFAAKWSSVENQEETIHELKNGTCEGMRDVLLLPKGSARSKKPLSEHSLQRKRERRKQRKESQKKRGDT